jgi:hypothetical protein
MWLVAEYAPTALFSLRISNATNAAAKTLLLPSPYCLKMALLDASFRRDGISTTQQRFEWIKRLRIRIQPPQDAVVNSCFLKIQRDERGGGNFRPTFALREYVAFTGLLRIAFDVSSSPPERIEQLRVLLVHVNQLGKRGSFVQLVRPPNEVVASLDNSFAVPIEEAADSSAGILQPLDDIQPSATLAQVDPFSDEHPNRQEIRRSQATIVPYRRGQTSKAFASYNRV